MSIVRIEEVVDHRPAPRLRGAHLDAPRSGSVSDVYGFELSGWAIARSAEIERVEVLRQNRPIAVATVSEQRPDVAETVACVDEARCGFRMTVGGLEVPRDFELTVRVTLTDGSKARLATIRGSRKPLEGGAPALQPAMINCIGRSGTTWLAWLLGCHPQVVALEPFSRETRVAAYWMTVLQRLGAPDSYLTQFDPVDLQAERWWLGEVGVSPGMAAEGEVTRWLGVDRLRLLARMCQEQIDRLYLENTDAGPATRYFVEKFQPFQLFPDLLDEIYPEAREIVLTRDFRDQYCSMRAYVAKRNRTAFGWKPGMDPADYVRTTMRGFAARLAARWEARRDDAFLVRYEDVVREPAASMAALTEFLGIDSAPDTIRRTLARASADDRGRAGHRTAPDPESSIGRWRRELSPELQEVFATALGPALETFGYDPAPASADGARL